jgi:hypothetical protein
VVALRRRARLPVADRFRPVRLLHEVEGHRVEHPALGGEEAGEIPGLGRQAVLDGVADEDRGKDRRGGENDQEQGEKREQESAANAHPPSL